MESAPANQPTSLLSLVPANLIPTTRSLLPGRRPRRLAFHFHLADSFLLLPLPSNTAPIYFVSNSIFYFCLLLFPVLPSRPSCPRFRRRLTHVCPLFDPTLTRQSIPQPSAAQEADGPSFHAASPTNQTPHAVSRSPFLRPIKTIGALCVLGWTVERLCMPQLCHAASRNSICASA